MVLAELPEQPMQLLERVGALEKIGAENVFSHYRSAVVSIDDQMLKHSCKDFCETLKSKSHLHADCPLRNAMQTDASPMARLIASFRAEPNLAAGKEWLFSVDSVEDIPSVLKGTPLETLLIEQNLGIIDAPAAGLGARLLVGMCVDFRNSLCMPRDWAFMIRREGANMAGAEFAIALALSKGVRHMALIAHSDCAMSNTDKHRDSFISTLSSDFGWKKAQAEELFEQHRRTREIGNEIDFAVEEALRIEKLFPGLRVVPMLFRVEDYRLYLIYDWLSLNASDDAILRRLELRDTGQFMKPARKREMPPLGS